MNASDVATVVAWHEALNAGDIDRLLALSTEDIEVGGPRGSGKGVQLLREWVGRAGIRLEVHRIFHRAGTVVVEEAAAWRAPDTGQLTGRQDVATVFQVRDGRVLSAIRHPDLASALVASGLSESDRLCDQVVVPPS